MVRFVVWSFRSTCNTASTTSGLQGSVPGELIHALVVKQSIAQKGSLKGSKRFLNFEPLQPRDAKSLRRCSKPEAPPIMPGSHVFGGIKATGLSLLRMFGCCSKLHHVVVFSSMM